MVITRGYNPQTLLQSTIISIPKDARGVLSLSPDNYKGISLFNSINKVVDYIVFAKMS